MRLRRATYKKQFSLTRVALSAAGCGKGKALSVINILQEKKSQVMSFWSLIAAFAPWIAFKVLVVLPVLNPILMTKLGIVVAAVLCGYMAWTGLHKGALLWGGLLFFGFGLITVPLMNNVWVMKHLGVLSHGTLAAFTWLSILIKKPFTAEYAKKHLEPQYWDSPLFMWKNNIITGAWGLAFSVNLLDAILKLTVFPTHGTVFEVLDNAALLAAAIFTTYYTKTEKGRCSPALKDNTGSSPARPVRPPPPAPPPKNCLALAASPPAPAVPAATPPQTQPHQRINLPKFELGAPTRRL